MWYVMQVQTGTEEKMKAQCMRVIDGKILEQCFIPSYVEKKRYRGTWHTGEKILFPGYVFMVSGTISFPVPSSFVRPITFRSS